MNSDEYDPLLVEDLLNTAEAVLKGQVGIIIGSRKLQSYRHELAGDLDEDFLPFIGVDSMTDHLPVDEERQNWSREALQRKDKEIKEAEDFYREMIFESSRKLIARFKKQAS